MNIGDLYFSFRGESKQLEADAKKAGDVAGKSIGQRMTAALKTGDWGGFLKTGFGVGAGIAAFGLAQRAFSGLGDSIGDAISDASDLVESQSKVDAVFKDSAGVIHDWADDLDSSYGLTKQAALEAAGTLGNFVQALGLSQDEAVTLSKDITELAGDLSSFNNTPVDDVLVALRSGLAGETEPVRRLGIDISAARIEAILLAKGIEKVNGQFSEGDKVAARYQAIMEGTTDAQGDAAKTADTLAGKQRQMNAVLGDLSAKLGGILIGPATDFLSFLVDIIDFSPDVSERVGRMTERFEALREEAEKSSEVAEALEAAVRPLEELDIAPTFRLGSWGKLTDEILEAANALSLTEQELFDLMVVMRGDGAQEADVLASLRSELSFLDDEAARATDSMATLPSIIKDTGEAAVSAEPPVEELASEATDLAKGMSSARERLLAFKDAADEIAGTRSLDKINKELREQRRALQAAAKAGNVRKFAAATAAIEQLKGEKELRQQGRQALREYLTRTKKQTGAQRLVTRGIAATKAEAEKLLEQTRKKYDVDIKVSDQQLSQALIKTRALGTALNTIGSSITAGVRDIFKADGGPVAARTPYIVGERGPEVFVPEHPGRIIPNHAISSTTTNGGQTVNAQIYGLPMQAQTPREVVAEMRRASRMGTSSRRALRGFQPA